MFVFLNPEMFDHRKYWHYYTYMYTGACTPVCIDIKLKYISRNEFEISYYKCGMGKVILNNHLSTVERGIPIHFHEWSPQDTLRLIIVSVGIDIMSS